MFSLLETTLIWWPGPHPLQRFYLEAGMISISLLGFVVASALRRLYGGTLSAEDGILLCPIF
jgi:hypothetical protein